MMITTNSFAVSTVAFLSTVAAQQFVMYTPGGDDPAVERIDPILAVGTVSAHVHQVFGSNALSSDVSYDSLQSATCTTVADASDQGNAQDNSIYWHPALYAEALDGSGYIRVPTNGHKLYYKNAGSPKDMERDPFEFPHGFRMLAGNPFMRAAATDPQQQNITQWICHDTSGTNQGTAGGFPTGVNNCAAYDNLNGAIHFPHCWNGADFNPASPGAHVTYPTGDIENGECPSSHPTRLPHIFMENSFDIPSVYGKIKQDSFVLAQGDNTGYGWHADFFSGWKDGAIPTLLANCVQGQYGNEDVGQCTAFQKRTTPASQCKLAVTYSENVNNPGHTLPGCNPVVDTNPAPKLAIAAVNQGCSGAVAYPSSSTTGSTPASSSNAPASSNPIPTYYSSQVSVPMSSTPTTLSYQTSSKSSPSMTSASIVKAPPTTIAGTPAPTSQIACPASNGTIYTATNGAKFQIECGINHHSGDMGWKTTHGLAACIAACASTPGCVDVSLSGVACYMKSHLGATEFNEGVNGAKLVSSGSKRRKYKVLKYVASKTDIARVTEYVTVTATPAVQVRHAHAYHHGQAKRAI